MARTPGNSLEVIKGRSRDMGTRKDLATEPADQTKAGIKLDSPIIPRKETVTRQVGTAPKVANLSPPEIRVSKRI